VPFMPIGLDADTARVDRCARVECFYREMDFLRPITVSDLRQETGGPAVFPAGFQGPSRRPIFQEISQATPANQ